MLLPTIIRSSLTICGAVPGAVAGTFGLIQAGEKTGFDKAYPAHYEKLINLNNVLLWALVEHWFGIIICSFMLGTFWALVVVEPKNASKDKFEKQRRDRE